MEPFSPEEVRRVNRDQQRARLEVLASKTQAGRVYPFRREYISHDADGNPTGTARRTVTVKVADENVDQQLTVLDVVVVSVHEDVAPDTSVQVLNLPIARACGYQTLQGLRDSWHDRHPRSPLARLIWFCLGDVRDQPLFMGWTGRGSDYVTSRHRAMDEAEALTRDQLAALSSGNRQKDEARRAKASQALAAETPSQRLLRIERVSEQLGSEARAAIRQHLRVIEQRIVRAEGRLKDD